MLDIPSSIVVSVASDDLPVCSNFLHFFLYQYKNATGENTLEPKDTIPIFDIHYSLLSPPVL